MKRSTFLKSMILAVTAPSILTQASPKKDIVKPDDKAYFDAERINRRIKEMEGVQNLQYDTLVMFVSQDLKVRIGDLIQSDMGDCALVTSIMQHWKIGADHLPAYENLQQLWCKPVQMLRYHYQDINKFKVLHRAAGEGSIPPTPIQPEYSGPTMPSNAMINTINQ